MADDATARDRRIFAPAPRPITFVLDDGSHVETDLFNFMDLPVKASIAVYTVEDEMRADKAGGYPAMVGYLRQLVGLLCPRLDAAVLEHVSPRQMQEAIAASHGVEVPPADAEGRDAASPSPSADSTTPSPPASAGAP